MDSYATKEEYLNLIREVTQYLLNIYECKKYIDSPIAGVNFYGFKECKKNIEELREYINKI